VLFLVAVTYIPLGHMGIIPLWVVFILMVREFAVTFLRSIFLEQKVEFKTSELAKYKTNVQMGGAAILFLLYTLSDSGLDRIFLGIPAGLSLIGLIIYHLVLKKSGLRAIAAVILLGGAFLVRLSMTPENTTIFIYTVILFFAILSGFLYAHTGWRELPHTIPLFTTRYMVSLIYYPLIFPLLFVGAVPYVKYMIWAVILLLSLEFANSGLDNHITYLGRKMKNIFEYIKILVQVLSGLLIVLTGMKTGTFDSILIVVCLVSCVVVTTIYTLMMFYRYRSTF